MTKERNSVKVRQYDGTLFYGTSKYYSRFRVGYDEIVFDFVCRELSLHDGDLVLDLGCGTGRVAIPLAQRGYVVYAIDPDVDMLREGILQERPVGSLGIRWILGDDFSLSRFHLPRFKLCTMGASFHWMNRPVALETLNRILADDGSVVILGANVSPRETVQLDWQQAVKDVVEIYLGKERRAGKGIYQHPPKRHEAVLKESLFRQVTEKTFENEIELSAEHIIGLQLSTSYASPALLGDRVDAFREDLMQRLLALSPNGRFPSKVTYEIIIGRR